MRSTRLRRALAPLTALAVLAGCALGAVPAAEAAPAHAAPVRADALLAHLRVAPRTPAAERPAAHWIAADGSCRTTDLRVLAARSSRPVAPGACRIRTGRWISAFTGARLMSAADVRVVRTVPYAEAMRSGGAAWSDRRRLAYANDLGFARSLLVVDAGSAARRGHARPTAWMPVGAKRCEYATSWIAVKARWRLSVTAAERAVLASDLHRWCRSAPMVSAPGTPHVAALVGSGAGLRATALVAGGVGTGCPAASASRTGDDLLPLVAAAARARTVRLAAGEHDLDDFAAAPWGVDLPASVGGLRGARAGGTVVRLRPCTSTRAADVPTAAGTTNQLSLLRISGSPVVADLTLQGTEQGHLYNGLRLNRTTRALVRRVAVLGVPGDAEVNPGETFAINDFHGHGSRFDHVLVDGQGVGASGLGLNSATSILVTDSSFVGLPFSAGIAVWQTDSVTAERTTFTGDKLGVNVERSGGTVRLTDCVFARNRADLRLISDLPVPAKVVIEDPVVTAADGRLRIRVPATYRGVPNTQTPADVVVLRDGQDVTASAVTWVR